MEENMVLDGQEVIAGAEPEQKERYAIGVVANCKKLNVRQYPDQATEVVTVASAGTELEIDLDMTCTDNAGNEWLYVCTASGIYGYSMSQYIEIQP